MNTLSGQIRQSIALIITFAIILTMLCLYFFVYVKHKEEYVNSRNFKILARAVHNLDSKSREYTSKHVTRNIINARLDKILEENPCDIQTGDLIETKSLKCIQLNIPKAIEEFTVENISRATKPKEEEKDTFFIAERPVGWSLVFDDYLTYNPSKTAKIILQVTSSIPISDFVAPLLQTGALTDYVIVELSTAKQIKVLYATCQLGVADSVGIMLFKNQNKIKTIMLNGTTYLSFNYPFMLSGKKCMLTGLQKLEQYQAETRSLDRPLLYTLVLITLLLLLSLPLIKIIFIGKNERLHKTDIIWCGLSLLLGCFFCTIIFIGIDVDDSKLYSDGGLEILSSQLEDHFTREIKEAYQTITIADAIFAKRTDYPSNETNVRDSAVCNNLPVVCQPTEFGRVNIHWSDKQAMQRFKWTNYKRTAKIDVSDRAYYKNINEGTAWKNPFDSLNNSYYVVESILSWTELEKKAVVSIRSKAENMLVVGLTKKLRSVIEPILPPGYKFCIADLQGNVWFHSDPNRNLNENIFEELQVSSDVYDQFYKPGGKGVSNYDNKEHAVRISVMNHFPLLLITLKDKTRDEQSKSFTQEITFALLGIYLTMVFLTIGLIRLAHRRAIKRLSLDWLKPDNSKMLQYLKITLFGIVITLLLLLVFALDVLMPLEEIFLLITLPLCILPSCFICLNIPSYRNYYKKPSSTVIIVTLLAVVAIDLFCWLPCSSDFQHWHIIILYQALFLISYPLFTKKLPFTNDFFDGLRSKLDQVQVFYLYIIGIFSLLILIGVLPTVVFFRHAFNYERTIYTMATQIEFVKQYYTKEGNRKGVLQDVYLVGIQKLLATNPSNREASIETDKAFTNFATLASLVTRKQPFTFVQHYSLEDRTLRVAIGDGKWHWNWNNKSRKLEFSPVQPDPYLNYRFVSTVEDFPFARFFLWAMGLGALTYLFFLLTFLCRRIFVFGTSKNPIKVYQEWLLPAMITDLKTDGLRPREFTSRKSLPLNPITNKPESDYLYLNDLFITGPPFFDKGYYLKKIEATYKGVPVDINMSDDLMPFVNSSLPVIDEKQTRLVIINNFEYGLANPVTNLLKLKVIENVFTFLNVRIIVFSTVHADQLFDANPEMDADIKERWHTVLSNFYKVMCPIEINSVPVLQGDQNPKDDIKRKRLYEFINKECNHGVYLQNLKPVLFNLVKKNDAITIPDLVLKIKSLVYNYYISLWHSCSLDEQYLIYDLAEDGLVNGKNTEAITRLLYKGIFISHNSLSLMNASFREFILSYVNPAEALILREKVAKNGSWNRVQVTLLISLAVVALFLLYSQKGLSTQIMGFLTAITAALPLLFKMMESFSNVLPKKTS